jgi:hypothetical protein
MNTSIEYMIVAVPFFTDPGLMTGWREKRSAGYGPLGAPFLGKETL